MKYLLVLLVGTLLLSTGCAGNMQEAAKEAAENPAQLPFFFVVTATTAATVLAVWSSMSLWISILNAVRITGALAIVLSPLYAMKMGMTAAIYVGVSGLLGVAVITALFWKDLYPKQTFFTRPFLRAVRDGELD